MTWEKNNDLFINLGSWKLSKGRPTGKKMQKHGFCTEIEPAQLFSHCLVLHLHL